MRKNKNIANERAESLVQKVRMEKNIGQDEDLTRIYELASIWELAKILGNSEIEIHCEQLLNKAISELKINKYV